MSGSPNRHPPDGVNSPLVQVASKTDLTPVWGYSDEASRPLVRVCSSHLSTAFIVAMHAQFGPGVTIMSKTQRSNKESKKQSTLTAKERKIAKWDKKKSGGHVPFVAKDT